MGSGRNEFSRLWLESYGTYYFENWLKNSIYIPRTLSNIFPHRVHLDKKLLFYLSKEQLYQQSLNVTGYYAIHLHLKLIYYIPNSLEDLDGYNCTVGNVMRTVLYNNSDLRSNKVTKGYKRKGIRWKLAKF